jgi:hypothetical protein
VDTSRPHNAKDHIRIAKIKRFGKAALGGGKPFIKKSVRKCKKSFGILRKCAPAWGPMFGKNRFDGKTPHPC